MGRREHHRADREDDPPVPRAPFHGTPANPHATPMPTSFQPNFNRRSTIGPLPRHRVIMIAARAASTVGTARPITSAAPPPSGTRFGHAWFSHIESMTISPDTARNTASPTRNAPNPHLWVGGGGSAWYGDGSNGRQPVPDQLWIGSPAGGNRTHSAGG